MFNFSIIPKFSSEAQILDFFASRINAPLHELSYSELLDIFPIETSKLLP